MAAWLDSMKSRLGLVDEEQQEQSLLQQFDENMTLDRTQRAIGFAVCVGIGLLLSFMAPMFIFRPTKFAALYSFGSVLSLCSTMFLMGPMKQLARMFDSRRLWSTVVYIVALVCTLVSAIVLHSVILSVLCIAVQFCAFIWYAASYIPFAQQALARLLPWESVDSAAG